MMQLTTQTVSSIWPMMGELGLLLTSSQSKTFGVECVTPERVTILTGKTRVMIPRNAFEAVLAYLHGHDHYAGNRCVIKSDNNYKKSGPLCKASRLLPTGAYGQRNITYVLPILQELGVVEINPKVPTSTWLVKHKVVAVVDRPLQSLIMGNTPPESLSPDQRAFAKHLAALWVGKPDSFVHRYQTSGHRAWGPWKTLQKGSDWWCSTLAQAAEHYSWPEKSVPDDFASIAARLRVALAKPCDAAAEKACLDIFKWGGLGRLAMLLGYGSWSKLQPRPCAVKS